MNMLFHKFAVLSLWLSTTIGLSASASAAPAPSLTKPLTVSGLYTLQFLQEIYQK